jgi:hypothetical protein
VVDKGADDGILKQPIHDALSEDVETCHIIDPVLWHVTRVKPLAILLEVLCRYVGEVDGLS